MSEKSRFLTELEAIPTRETDGGRTIWKLTQDLAFFYAPRHETFVAPKGFESDFASIPRVPFIYLVMNDRGHKAAVIHDRLCRDGRIPRELADKVFRAALRAEGVSAWRAWLMYRAVRLAGAKPATTWEMME